MSHLFLYLSRPLDNKVNGDEEMKPYLFFLKVETPLQFLYVTLRFDSDEEENEKVYEKLKIELKTGIKELLENIYGKGIKFVSVIPVYNDDCITQPEHCMALTKFIFFDNSIGRWMHRNFLEPNYKLINLVNYDLTLKVICVGTNFQEYLKGDNRTEFIHTMQRLSYINNVEVNTNSYNNVIELLNMFNENDANSKYFYTIILPDGSTIKQINEINDSMRKNSRVIAYILSEKQFYEICDNPGKVCLKKVNLI